MSSTHHPRVVERRGDHRQRLDPRVEGAVPEGVATTQADADTADPLGVDRVVGGEQAGRGAQVGELAGGVLVLADAALAGAEVAMVEHQRHEPGLAQHVGVLADDLLLDTGERTGEHERRKRPDRRRGLVGGRRAAHRRR